MVLAATLLIALGLVVSLLGLKLFKILLPLVGLVSGAMVGFLGVQAVFGGGVVSTAIAIMIAVITGVVMAILSYAFFELAVIIYAAILGAAAFSYLGVALGLNEQGFIVFMLGLSGAILTAVLVSQYAISVQLVVAFTALVGVAYVLVGLMLIVGSVSLDDLSQTGVVQTLLRVVDQSFLWFIVWFGGGLLAMQVQYRAAMNSMLSNSFEFQENTKK